MPLCSRRLPIRGCCGGPPRTWTPANVVAEENTTAITAIADGERVEITTAGPRAATCSCPASGICRHKLAAVLLLQAARPTDLPQGATGAGYHGAPQPDALVEVLALTPQAIRSWAGNAGTRAALDIVAQAEPSIDYDGGSLRVRLGAAWPQVAILAGQGLDGIVSKAVPSRQKPLHAAAVIAVRRAHGLDAEAYAEAQVPSSEAKAADADFIDKVLSAVEDAVPTVLVHAPEVLEERFFVLSVSSRADDLPLLSRRLRQIAGNDPGAAASAISPPCRGRCCRRSPPPSRTRMRSRPAQIPRS